jgi:uncharacterized protein
MKIRVFNQTRGVVVADAADLAGDSSSRKEGLLKRTGLNPGEGLWIVPCEAIHCFFMKFTIDVLFLDKSKKVVKARASLKPWRMSGSIRAHSVLELPEGRIAETGTLPGDQLEIEKVEEP